MGFVRNRSIIMTRNRPLNQGLVLDLRMSEGLGSIVHDVSPYGNHGTIYGASWVDGRFGKALNFNGLTDYVEVPTSVSLNPSAQPFTVEVWFKLNAVGSLNGSILYNKENLYEASAGGGYFTYAWQPHWAWDGGTSFPVNVGEWYHAVVVYDKVNQIVYKNGGVVYSRGQIGDIGTNTNALRMGARGAPGAASSFFPGIIGKVRAHNRALSPVEVLTRFKSRGFV